jgi:hypothetical protein
MTSLNNSVVNVGDGDEIIQVLELQQEDSVSTNYSLYSSEAYPSIFNLNTNSSTGSTREKIIINQPASATQGILNAEDVALLRANNDAYIFFNGEIYNLNGKEHSAGYLTYTNSEYESGETRIRTITIILSNLTWNLQETVVASKQYVTSQIGAIDMLLTQLNTGSGV